MDRGDREGVANGYRADGPGSRDTVLREVAFKEKLGYNMLIPIKINWVDQGPITGPWVDQWAVVDTAAQVTVLSVNFAKKLALEYGRAEKVLLKGAAKEGCMTAFIVRQVRISVEKKSSRGMCMWHLFQTP